MDNLQDSNISEIVIASRIDNLDKVLNYLASKSEGMIPAPGILIYFGNQGLHLTISSILLILEKLIKDGFVSFNNNPSGRVYQISFEGLVFHQQGGYKQKLVNDNRLKNHEESNKKTQKILFWFTAIVAFGTLIAAVYYSIEIWKFIHGK